VLGAGRAELLSPEVESIGDLLYYTLTVWLGAGGETLGQEYCHLMLVEGQQARGGRVRGEGRRGGGEGILFLPLSGIRRGIVVLGTVFGNYVWEVRQGGREGEREGGREEIVVLGYVTMWIPPRSFLFLPLVVMYHLGVTSSPCLRRTPDSLKISIQCSLSPSFPSPFPPSLLL